MSIDQTLPPTPTLVVHACLHERGQIASVLDAKLDEATGLCEAIALNVVQACIVRIRAVAPATFIGKGKAEELAAIIETLGITLTVMDCALTPLQQRNLEKALSCKVIDRTALILEIFGARARTSEGKLQVELAALNYQKSRLVRSWTHLERQRGGFGFMGGPGESQIEIDRRLIGERIDKIKAQLARAVRTRSLHRKRRRDAPYPVVALVGYTNAGKSTLFNALTQADVMAKDMLFATLDPTLRALKLPSSTTVMLADTVGFIANLPTELIAAFRATLEEVLEADVLLHIRDASADARDEQKSDVMAVLKNLFGKDGIRVPMIEVMNKIDLLKLLPSPAREGSEMHPCISEGVSLLPHPSEKTCFFDSPLAGSENNYVPHPAPSPLGEGEVPNPPPIGHSRAGGNLSVNLLDPRLRGDDETVPLSAVTGENIPALLRKIDEALQEEAPQTYRITLPAADGKTYAWLHAHARVKKIKQLENGDHEMQVALSVHQLQKLTAENATNIIILPAN